MTLQTTYWSPIIAWLKTKYDLDIVTTDGIVRIQQPDKALTTFREIVESYDPLKLAAFEQAVLRSKSFMIGLALVEREISVEFATKAARLEVMQQIDRWGEVEGNYNFHVDAHDLEREDLRRQFGSVIATLIK